MKQQSLLDLSTDSPRTLSPENMSQDLALELTRQIFLGDFELNAWQTEFICSCTECTAFSLDQRKVIYNLAFKFRLL